MLVQLRNAHTILVRRHFFCDNVHRDLRKKHIRADSGRRGDAGDVQYIADHAHRQLMRRAAVGHQIVCDIHEHLVNRIDMDILRRDIFQIDLIDSRADLHIPAHLRRRGDIIDGVLRMPCKLIRKDGAAGQCASPHTASAPFIFLRDLLDRLKQPRPARYADRFQGRRHRKADRFLGAARIRDDQIGIERVKPALHALDRSIKRFQINTDIDRHRTHPRHAGYRFHAKRTFVLCI